MADIAPSGGPMAFVERQLEELSPRDRKLLLGLVCFGTVIGLALMSWTLWGFLDDKASRVRNAKSNLALIQEMQKQYEEAAGDLERQESRLASYKGQRLSAHIESLANKHGVSEQLRSVNETGAEVVGNIKQTTYSVEVKRADMQSLINFLYELETSGYPASVKVADFRSVSSREGKVLDLSMEVVVFSLAEG